MRKGVSNVPFPEIVRQYALRASGHRCQIYSYSEDKGFSRCPETDHLEVHHIQPAEWQTIHGEDQNQSDWFVACRHHHSGGDGLPFEASFSFHPDFGEAQQKYRDGDKDAYTAAAHDHFIKARQGIIYWNNQADDYYLDLTRRVEWQYHLKHPEDPRPHPKPHRNYDPSKKTHWTDIVVGLRSYPEDEG